MSKKRKKKGKEIPQETKELSEWQKRNQEYLKKKAEEDFTKQSQALFINLGHLSAEKEKSIRVVASYATQVSLPMVVDGLSSNTF